MKVGVLHAAAVTGDERGKIESKQLLIIIITYVRAADGVVADLAA